MKTESIKELIDFCRAWQCAVKLEACQTGVVANVTSNRGKLFLQTSVYLDSNDKDMRDKLESAARLVQ